MVSASGARAARFYRPVFTAPGNFLPVTPVGRTIVDFGTFVPALLLSTPYPPDVLTTRHPCFVMTSVYA